MSSRAKGESRNPDTDSRYRSPDIHFWGLKRLKIHSRG